MSTSDLDLAARRLVALAELDEPEISPTVERLTAHAGGVLVGLANRIKSVDSLRRKLGDLQAQDPAMTVDQAAEGVFDVLRFTVVVEADRYVVVHREVLDGLRRQGVDVVADDNRWGGPGYRGINTRLRAGARRFEVQFHTRASFEAAKATRGLYEEYRLASTPPRPSGRAGGRDRCRVRRGSDPTGSGSLMGMNVVFCASTIGAPETRVLARFVTDESGLHVERLDRRARRWAPDSSVAGFLTGHDDWARRITRHEASQIVTQWQLDPTILDAPVAQPATA